MADRIYTARDMVKLHGQANMRDFVHIHCAKLGHLLAPHWTGKINPTATPAVARVDFGRWCASCPREGCNGSEYIDLDDPFFFCFGCGNSDIGGDARPVVLPDPEVRAEVERLLLARPVRERPGPNPLSIAMSVKLTAPGFSRTWEPHETVEDLRAQNTLMESALNEIGESV